METTLIVSWFHFLRVGSQISVLRVIILPRMQILKVGSRGLATLLERANIKFFKLKFKNLLLFYLTVLFCCDAGDSGLILKPIWCGRPNSYPSFLWVRLRRLTNKKKKKSRISDIGLKSVSFLISHF